MEDVITPAKALFKALREAKNREEAAQAATVYWNTRADGTVTGNGRLDYLPSGIYGSTTLEERARIVGPDGIQAEIIFAEGERAAIKIEHDFITGYPSVVTLTLPARFFGE